MNDIKLMNKAADNIRILAASMVEKAKSGHPGGAMGGADFVNVLFSEFLVYDPKNPAWEGRDRYFQDPGHMSPMLYSVLALAGKFTIDELKEFRQWGSVTPGHPEVNVMRGTVGYKQFYPEWKGHWNFASKDNRETVNRSQTFIYKKSSNALRAN